MEAGKWDEVHGDLIKVNIEGPLKPRGTVYETAVAHTHQITSPGLEVSYLVRLSSKLATMLFMLSKGFPPSFTTPLVLPRSVTALPDFITTALATFWWISSNA